RVFLPTAATPGVKASDPGLVADAVPERIRAASGYGFDAPRQASPRGLRRAETSMPEVKNL
ncbi:MAG: hypothetical protein ACU85V_13830, partial [Gammaproteobacteria bacterium]